MVWKVLGIVALIVVAGAAIVWFGVRPGSHRRGATDAEVARAMPGDELVPNPRVGYTQAITIEAPASAVWPWVVQIGYKRAGWYTYDWVYKMMGAAEFYDGPHSAKRIIPELQELRAGDQIKIFEQAPFTVMALEPERVLALLARVDTDSGEYFELDGPLPAHYLNNSWVYLMEAVGENRTRLVVRWRGDYSPGLANALSLGIPTEAGALIMQPKMLRGIKERAEASRR